MPSNALKALRAALALAPSHSPADSLAVRIDAGGAAHLLALNDEVCGCGITVPKERRREIGLRILGGPTVGMVQEIAARGWDVQPSDHGTYQDEIYDVVRTVLVLLDESA